MTNSLNSDCNLKRRHFLTELICALFVFLFVYTGVSKLDNSERFKDVLHGNAVLRPVAGIVSNVIPAGELVVAVLLIFPVTRRYGLYAALGFMSLFTIYIGWMLWFAEKLPCQCGGIIEQMTWKEHFVFNLVLTGLLITALIKSTKNKVAR